MIGIRKKNENAPPEQVRKLEARVAELEAMAGELDKVAKMLVRRDRELSETRTRREQEVVELRAKTLELERFNKLAVGRELRMRELKKEITELRGRLRKYENPQQ